MGIRCFPDKLSYVILDGNIDAPIEVESDTRKFPRNLKRAGFLNWISVELKNILRRRSVTGAAFKEIETTARKNTALLKRAEVEGVVQAVLYEAGCRTVEGLNKRQIKSKLLFDGPAGEIVEALEGTALNSHRNKDTEDAAITAWALLK